jgi:hypothetical protein
LETQIRPLFEKKYGVKVVFLTQDTVAMLARADIVERSLGPQI